MAKGGFFSKVLNTPIARLTRPKGGVFAGRRIPKERLDDIYWLRVLELAKPPDDGLYTTREQFEAQSGAASAAPSKQKSLPVRALYGLVKAAVEYEQGAAKKKHGTTTNTSNATTSAGTKAVRPRKPTSSTNVKRTFDIADWNEISPDFEAERLGLEQLEKGDTLSIVGAGITGLTLAWIVNRSRPDVKIVVYDKSSEAGGWMSSRRVVLPDGLGETVFESGPRTLLPSHPGSEILARILHEIGARDELMRGLPRSAATNQKALMYNGRIQKLPSSGAEAARFLASAPILRGARWAALKDLWAPARAPGVHDESVSSFVSRRLGRPLADRMISALMRGIYAADSTRLSARSVARLNRMYYLEGTEQMSILGAALTGSLAYLEQTTKFALPVVFDALAPPRDRGAPRALVDKDHPTAKFSLYGFKNGIQSVAKALSDDLSSRKNVRLELGTGVARIERYKASKVRLQLENGAAADSNIVVSTVAQPELFEAAAPAAAAEMRAIPYSSLAVVNVWVPNAAYARDWFGILVPKTEDEWNTEGVLGIIFDSSVRNAMTADTAQREPGASMTVMLGGDLWTEMTREEARARALRGLQKILGPLDEAKAVVHVALQRNAIPLYEVGHSARQHRIHSELSRAYAGRVAAIGMAVGRGVGVSDCVVDALTVALRFTAQRQLLHPEFFFNHWLATTRPELYV